MTPAINAAKKGKITFTVHEYPHNPDCVAYGLEAAEKLHVPPGRIFKTLVVDAGGELVVALVPVNAMLALKHIAKAAGSKKAIMAEATLVERSTGYVLGGVSPLGQKKRLRTFIDATALTYPTIHVSAGRRGVEIELAPHDLARLINAKFADLRQ
ncbi:MAG: Cys-tRNA(Pro) deacylase [Deltaproteobacteria bacterium]|nr:Cys-tRNA(Pro) deacylase [Deltaproteobacteria bacterium]